MIYAYALLALVIAQTARDLRDVRRCALAILAGLGLTVAVQYTFDGINAYAIWGAIWCAAAVFCARQMWCSALLFLSGLCYLPTYIFGYSVAPWAVPSFVIDGFGMAALLVLGGQVIGDRLGNSGIVRVLGMGYPIPWGNR